MNKVIFAATAALCTVGIVNSADAFCAAGDPQVCAHPFADTGSALQSDGTATQKGFDARTGNQWSTSSRKFGDFTFYSGVSSGNSWDSRQRVFGTGLNGPAFGS